MKQIIPPLLYFPPLKISGNSIHHQAIYSHATACGDEHIHLLSYHSFSVGLARFPADSLTTRSVTQTQFLAFQNSADTVLTLKDIWPLRALNLTQISIDLNLTMELRGSSSVEFTSLYLRVQLSLLITDSKCGWRAPGITLHHYQNVALSSMPRDTLPDRKHR